ncbi:MAG: hypothetical protein ACRD2E_03970 [Terriglobales bacterium]
MHLRSLLVVLAALGLAVPAATAAELGATTQSVLPATTRQIISVNFHRLTANPLATRIEAQVLPTEMRNISRLLARGGVNVQQDLNRLTFATFSDGHSIGLIGVAAGNFEAFQTSRFFRPSPRYPNPPQLDGVSYYDGGGLDFFLPDPTTFVFGSLAAIREAIQVQSGTQSALDANSSLTDLIAGTESTDVWSVLDAAGTQGLITSLAGGTSGFNPASLASHFQGARYTIDFSSDVKVNLELMTDDPVSAGLASTGLRAALLFKAYQTHNPELKNLLNEIEVDSAGDNAFLQVESPQSQVASLLNTPLFRSMLH